MFAKVVPKGKSNLKFTWSKVNGAQGYDIYIGRSNFDGNAISCQLQKTIKGNRRFHWTKKKLRKHTYYKAYVKAWIMKNGKKETIRKSIYVRTITSGANKQYTAPRNITVKTTKLTLKSGATHKINATISKYKKKKKKSKYLFGVTYKTSNDKIASVDKNGKITAKSSGNCKVYAIAANGARKTIHVTVEQ